jgi:Leucine-rich repeat (LRR) protein
LSKLKRLNLANNSLESLDSIELNKFSNLESVNLSFNSIKVIKSSYFTNKYIGSIDLSFNLIETIGINSFLDSPELYELNLKNNKLKLFSLNDLSLPCNLVTFKLSHNQIGVILFDNLKINKIHISHLFTKTKIIDFSYNKLTEFYSVTYFNGFNYLENLNLQFNYIKLLNINSFLYLTNLIELNIDHNSIEDIENYAFNHLIKLETLHLENNKLSKLDDFVFDGLFRLNYLSLRNNRIKHINNKLFCKLTKLNTLDLSSNELYLIKDYSFLKLNYLSDLYLNNNYYLTIENSSLNGLNSIRNIFVDMDLFMNKTFKLNFLRIIRPRISKHNFISQQYYESLEVISYPSGSGAISIIEECKIVLDFIKVNLHINLKDDYQVEYFFKNCKYIDL